MKSKKILLIFFIAIATILSNRSFVYADSFNVTMSPDKQNYAEGQTVEVTVSLANIESSVGIYGLSAKLDYNTDVFEKIESNASGVTEDILSLNGWGSVTYNSSTNELSIFSQTPISSGTQSIIKIKLKVKQGAPLGKATIMLSELVGSNADNDITTAPVSVSVNIQNASDIGGGEIPPVTSQTPSPNPSQIPSPAPSPVQQNSPKPNNGGSSSNGGNKLPQTGLAKDVILPIIIGAVIISGVSFIAYRKYKDI